MTKETIDIAFFGSSLLSAYWNGAATYYRGIVAALARRGHKVTFYEPDAFDRQKHRDMAQPEWAKVVVYSAESTKDVNRCLLQASFADVLVKASGVGVFDAYLEAAVLRLRRDETPVVYWDVDAPATLDRLRDDPSDPFCGLISRYDAILTYGGGLSVVEAYRLLGARECIPIYNAVDPSTHFPVGHRDKFRSNLCFLGSARQYYYHLRDGHMFNRLVAWFIFIGITSIPLFLIALLIWVVTYPFDRRLQLLHLYTCFWASIYTWIMPAWRLRVEGRELVRKDEVYMVVSNHQSLLDIPVVFRFFFHFKWVSKIEVFRIPLIGWNMILNRYIKLKRGDRASVEKMLRKCAKRIDEGSSIFMFPEGTRSSDGVVKAFKLGAFQLALEKKIPILPVVISGTNRALPKESLDFTGVRKIYIRIFEEIPYTAFAHLTAQETAEMVRAFIIEKLEMMDEYTLTA